MFNIIYVHSLRQLQAVFTSVWPSDDKLKILTQLLSHLEPYKCHAAAELFASEHKDDDLETPLLAVCIGNRSAVLYEMNRAEVITIECSLSTLYIVSKQYPLFWRSVWLTLSWPCH